MEKTRRSLQWAWRGVPFFKYKITYVRIESLIDVHFQGVKHDRKNPRATVKPGYQDNKIQYIGCLELTLPSIYHQQRQIVRRASTTWREHGGSLNGWIARLHCSISSLRTSKAERPRSTPQSTASYCCFKNALQSMINHTPKDKESAVADRTAELELLII
jgi:hypothetical protein